MNTRVVQRWRERVGSYRPAGEPFDPCAHEVVAIPDDTTAKRFVVEHHYSSSYPAARWRFGLYEHGALVGVAVYSVPMRAEVLRPFGANDATELGRLVLLDRVRANAESWFIARTFEALRAEGVAGVVSFSDPEPRTSVNGDEVFAGHTGRIYQAFNASYLGRTKPDVVYLLPDGRSFSPRALAKIRARDRGWRYAVEQLIEAGARPPMHTGHAAALDAWVAEEFPRIARFEHHPGKLKYAFALRESYAHFVPPSLPYVRITAPRPTCARFDRRAA